MQSLVTQVVALLALTAAVLLHAVLPDAGRCWPDVHRMIITCVEGCHVVGQGPAAAQLSVWPESVCSVEPTVACDRALLLLLLYFSPGFKGPLGQHWLPNGVCDACTVQPGCRFGWLGRPSPGCCWHVFIRQCHRAH